MSGPFRDQETLYLCPRCGDVMVAVFEGVLGCVRCQGTWIPQPIVERAFGSPTWPVGANAWWHRALDCPECANKMNAVSSDSTLVDRCPAHGAWLDQGELRRLLSARDASDLAALHRKLGLATPFVEIDYASDSLRRRQLELTRQRQAQLDGERAAMERQEAASANEAAEQARELRARAEQQRAERAAVERQRVEVELQRLQEARAAEAAREAAEKRASEARKAAHVRALHAEQRELLVEHRDLEEDVARKREDIARMEKRLAFLRARLILVRNELELP